MENNQENNSSSPLNQQNNAPQISQQQLPPPSSSHQELSNQQIPLTNAGVQRLSDQSKLNSNQQVNSKQESNNPVSAQSIHRDGQQEKQEQNPQPQNQDADRNQQQSKQSISQRNQSQRSVQKQPTSSNQIDPVPQEKRSHRASKVSQQSQSRSMSRQNESRQNQERRQNQKRSDEVEQEEEQRNFDQVESTVVKKNESGEVIKKVIQTIKIIRSSKIKPFLGGFRHATTDIIYHNAFSQTDQNRTQHKLQFTRQVQTYEYSSKSSKVPREFGTQMEKEGLFIDERNDRIVYPGVYFTSEMWLERRIEAALYIQRLTRGMFARNHTNKLKAEKLAKELYKLNIEEEERKKEEVKHKKEIERRRNPRTKEDFEILHEELENWRMAEIEKIKGNKTLTSDQRRKALKQTLDKETDLLQTIDRLKIIAAKQNKDQKVQKFLKSMSDPKRWVRKYDGRVTEVHTPFTVRAKQLMDLYKGLKMKNVSTDERLDILLATKWTVKEWDCNLTREIVELIDREGSILDRGRPESSLEGLRLRLSNLFLQFIEYPLFNPEAARFQKIPYEIAEVGEQFH